jgi:hypothetical protein
MPSVKVGERVGAVSHTEADKVFMFGFGVYQGEKVPPKGIRFMGMDLNAMKHYNPCVLLDNGKEVWGCECWWGPEELIKRQLEGKTVVELDVEQERGKAHP